MSDNFIRNYVCDCDHTDIMHSEHDGCSLCDCEVNRAEVITIGKLHRKVNKAIRILEHIYDQHEHHDNVYAQGAAKMASDGINELLKEET